MYCINFNLTLFDVLMILLSCLQKITKLNTMHEIRHVRFVV